MGGLSFFFVYDFSRRGCYLKEKMSATEGGPGEGRDFFFQKTKEIVMCRLGKLLDCLTMV